MSFLVPSQRGVAQQTLPDIPPVHNQAARSHLPLSSFSGYPHQDMPTPSAPSMPTAFTTDPTSHNLPKFGETRCCKSFHFVPHFHIQPPALPPPVGPPIMSFHSLGRTCTNPPLTFRLVLVIIRFAVHLPRSRPRKPPRRSGRAPHRKVAPQLCPPRGTSLCKGRLDRGSRTTNNAWHCYKVRLCPYTATLSLTLAPGSGTAAFRGFAVSSAILALFHSGAMVTRSL